MLRFLGRLGNLVRCAGLIAVLPGCMFMAQAFAQESALGAAPGRMHKPRTAYEEKLDALLQQRRFVELFDAVNARDVDTMDRALEWLRVELKEHGQGTPIAYMYAIELFRAGGSLQGLIADAFKQAALTAMVMTRWMIATEGFQCADAASPKNRLDLVNRGFAGLERHYQSIAAIHHAEVARSAFRELQTRYPHRVDDEWLCMDGPAYAAAYIAKYGPTNEPRLPYDPELRPEIRPAAEWSAERERALQEIVRKVHDELQVNLR